MSKNKHNQLNATQVHSPAQSTSSGSSKSSATSGSSKSSKTSTSTATSKSSKSSVTSGSSKTSTSTATSKSSPEVMNPDKSAQHKEEFQNHIRRFVQIEDDGSYLCTICPFLMSTLPELLSHFSQLHRFKIEKIDDVINEVAENESPPPAKKQKIVKKPLPANKQKFVKKFPCPRPDCEIEFTRRRQIPIHISSVHEERRPYPCKVCTFFSKRSSDIITHRRNVHKMDKKAFELFEAKEKAKSTRTSTSSNVTDGGDTKFQEGIFAYVELYSAQGDIEFGCLQCNFTAKGKVQLSRHLNTEHKFNHNYPAIAPVEGDEFTCASCPEEVFNSMDDWTSHSCDNAAGYFCHPCEGKGNKEVRFSRIEDWIDHNEKHATL